MEQPRGGAISPRRVARWLLAALLGLGLMLIGWMVVYLATREPPGGYGDAFLPIFLMVLAPICLAIVGGLWLLRESERSVAEEAAITVAALLVGAGAVAALTTTDEEGDPSGMNPEDSNGPSLADGPAPVHESREEACRAFLADRQEVGTESVTEAVALADTDRLKPLVDDDPGVILVGTSQCDTEWVVHVGVRHRDVDVPAFGEGGTPVLVFLQSEFSAFDR